MRTRSEKTTALIEALKSALAQRDLDALTKIVEGALKVYAAGMPAEPKIDTAFGKMALGLIFDEDTKWQQITAEFTVICTDLDCIPADADEKVERAKIIATNPVLRHVTAVPASVNTDELF